MHTKTIAVLALAILVTANPFKTSAQKRIHKISTTVKVEPVNSSVQSDIEELRNENQKLSEKNTELESRLNQLEKDLSNCCMSYKSAAMGSQPGINDFINDVAKLEQNTPNPFKEKTVIKYYIPSKAAEAFIKIYSLFGSELLSFPIASKGLGEIEFSGKTLSAGTFTYILIVDGKAVDTKQMVLTK